MMDDGKGLCCSYVAELTFTTSSPTKTLERTAAADSSLITILGCRWGPFFGLSKKQHLELEVLDAVALYLDRNGDEGTVAVAIDKDSVAVRFVLAKQITPSAEDINHAKKLFSIISPLQSPLEFLPFALENSSINVRKKVSKISEFEMDIVEKYIEEHQFLEGLHEFTNSITVVFANQLATQWSLSPLEPKALSQRVYVEAKAMAANIITSDSDITNTTFTVLLQIVYLIVHSHFGSLLIGYDHVTTPKSLVMSKIRRRFRKLSQYYTGAEQIHHYRKFVLEGAEIPHLWVQGPEPTTLTLSPSPIATASRHFPTLTEEFSERAQPTLVKQWDMTALPVVHPELRILLHFETIPLRHPRRKIVRLIGCTRKCCWCCIQWIQRWNIHGRDCWTTSRRGGYSSHNSSLTGMSYNADEFIVDQVNYVVDNVLERSTGHRLERPELKLSPSEEISY